MLQLCEGESYKRFAPPQRLRPGSTEAMGMWKDSVSTRSMRHNLVPFLSMDSPAVLSSCRRFLRSVSAQ